MGRHNGRFRWRKYSRYKGNLKDWWRNPRRIGERHRKPDLGMGMVSTDREALQ